MSETARKLKSESSKFKWGAKKMNYNVRAPPAVPIHLLRPCAYSCLLLPLWRGPLLLQAMYKKYAPVVGVGVFVCVVVYWQLF